MFCLVIFFTIPALQAQPVIQVDLATIGTDDGTLHRSYGSQRDGLSSTTGDKGTPVAGGFDMDGDGLRDYALASIKASPLGRTQAGEVFLVFGDGQVNGTVNTAIDQPRLLRIIGATPYEHAGSEITMDDVTGDGLGDLLICRQDYSPVGGEVGAGALSVVVGSASLRDLSRANQPLDLGNPPPGVTVFTLTGSGEQDRLCIWARTGDVDGDNTADVVIGADQQDGSGVNEVHQGALYLLRGGSDLASSTRHVNVNSLPADLLGDLSHLTLAPGSNEYHLGATCQIADLDGNGRGEVMGAAALSRSGASLGPQDPKPGSVHATGGVYRGAVFIFWDDNFGSGAWPPSIRFDQAVGATTVIRGGADNLRFGEEILGGLDYDNDGHADLFIGDLVATPLQRYTAGIGDVIYHAANLKNLDFSLNPNLPPVGTQVTRFYGPSVGAIGADTGLHGDFNNDGIDDLAFGAPEDDPLGRVNAGTLYVFWGQQGRWPALIDLQPGSQPPPEQVQITEVYGALGSVDRDDDGDKLAYSGAVGDINGDGYLDAIVNEMTGRGLAAGAEDVGNLLVISGLRLDPRIHVYGFE